MKHRKRVTTILVLLLTLALLPPGCGGKDGGLLLSNPPLKVGMSPDYPPLAFKKDGELKGIEVDFAVAAGKEMGREAVFMEMPFDQLIPSLNAGTIDVIMTGMSITRKREGEVRFLPPYTVVGQMAIIRKDRISQLGHPAVLKRQGIRIGCVMNTTGEFYVKNNLPAATRVPLVSVNQGFQALRSYAIDVFIHDAPTAWRIAEDPSLEDLFSLYHPLTEEYLAWAVSKTDSYTYNELNKILSTWKENGYLDTVLTKWIPVKITVE